MNQMKYQLRNLRNLHFWSHAFFSPTGERVKASPSVYIIFNPKTEMQRTPWVLKVSKSWLGCVSLSASLSRSLDAAMEKYPVPAWRTRWKLWVGNSVGNLCRNLFKFMNYAKLQETIKKKYTKTIEYTFQCFDNKKKTFFDVQEDNKKMKMQRARDGESHWILKKRLKKKFMFEKMWRPAPWRLHSPHLESHSWKHWGQAGAR